MIPVKFRTSTEGSNIAYDYVDISDGTGTVLFYGGTNGQTSYYWVSAPLQDYHLSGAQLFQNAFRSRATETAVTISGGNDAININLKFDLAKFNMAKIIKGTAYFEIPTYTTNTKSYFNYVTLQKISPTGLITDLNTATTTSGAAFVNNGNSGSDIVKLDLPTPTNFAAGDTLRLLIEGRAPASGAGNPIIVIAHDPLNRDGTYIKPSVNTSQSTILKAWIPFKIDL